ncbi:unnamed protein product, partial [Choristocarpus tenellus]
EDNDTDKAGGNMHTLWEQMTAREGRDAAHRAGMLASDWEAQRHLQQALRESQVKSTRSEAVVKKESNLVRLGFQALGMHEAEDPGEVRKRVSGKATAGASTARGAPDDAHVVPKRAQGEEGEEGEEENDNEVMDPIEMIVRRDGFVSTLIGNKEDEGMASCRSGRKTASGKELANHGQGRRGEAGVGRGGRGKRSISGAMEKEIMEQGDEGEVEEEGEGEVSEEQEEPPHDVVLCLSEDALHQMMGFLNADDIAECQSVSKNWGFARDEEVFEELCRRTYLAQSSKKILNVQRWKSWHQMFKLRPRLRTTGLYTLKTTYYKKPVRDMSTNWVAGTLLEVTYYRYFKFYEDGYVAYGLTHENPRDFVRMLQESSPNVIRGTYTISRWEVLVTIPTQHATVSFLLRLANGERGRFTHLVVEEHRSIATHDPRAGSCRHRVKSTDIF